MTPAQRIDAMAAQATAKAVDAKAKRAAHAARLRALHPDFAAFVEGMRGTFGPCRVTFIHDRGTGETMGSIA